MAKKQNDCNDSHCIVHGRFKIHGRSFVGTVTSSKMSRTAIVEWDWWRYVPKYERYERKITRVKAHNPDCINADKGDLVTINECRPISKTKHFVIIEKHAKNIAFLEKEDVIARQQTAKVEKKFTEVKNEAS